MGIGRPPNSLVSSWGGIGQAGPSFLSLPRAARDGLVCPLVSCTDQPASMKGMLGCLRVQTGGGWGGHGSPPAPGEHSAHLHHVRAALAGSPHGAQKPGGPAPTLPRSLEWCCPLQPPRLGSHTHRCHKNSCRACWVLTFPEESGRIPKQPQTVLKERGQIFQIRNF